ncbi:MAG TPA: hypothetical protein VG603_16560, partial [Chitinophagales bacterium]|nr:hypothetical protein [Chitinophagales bacterium]
FFSQTAAKYNVPVVSHELTPIYFIAIGKKEVSYKLSTLLQKEGYYCMNTVFPAVPLKNSGLRITVHNHLSLQDINGILEVIGTALPKILAEENSSMEEIYQAFNMAPPSERAIPTEIRKIA